MSIESALRTPDHPENFDDEQLIGILVTAKHMKTICPGTWAIYRYLESIINDCTNVALARFGPIGLEDKLLPYEMGRMPYAAVAKRPRPHIENVYTSVVYVAEETGGEKKMKVLSGYTQIREMLGDFVGNPSQRDIAARVMDFTGISLFFNGDDWFFVYKSSVSEVSFSPDEYMGQVLDKLRHYIRLMVEKTPDPQPSAETIMSTLELVELVLQKLEGKTGKFFVSMREKLLQKYGELNPEAVQEAAEDVESHAQDVYPYFDVNVAPSLEETEDEIRTYELSIRMTGDNVKAGDLMEAITLFLSRENTRSVVSLQQTPSVDISAFLEDDEQDAEAEEAADDPDSRENWAYKFSNDVYFSRSGFESRMNVLLYRALKDEAFLRELAEYALFDLPVGGIQTRVRRWEDGD